MLLGPDGVGKSSVINGIGSGWSAGFRECKSYHLRPIPFRRQRQPETNCDPHGKPARGTLVSVFKLVYLLLANWLGYLAAVRPQLAQGTLVLFDRYFPDCLVDPKRYRLPPSCQCITKLIASLLPEPDLYLVLDAPMSVLQQRKREVTQEESERQRKAYAMGLARLPNLAVVDAARPLAEVVEGVLGRVIELHLAGSREGFKVA